MEEPGLGFGSRPNQLWGFILGLYVCLRFIVEFFGCVHVLSKL